MARPRKTPKINHGGNRTKLDDLDDNMLTQILLRLPNCATVVACSPVNKRWCSLISDPNFPDQFTNHKKKTTTLLKGSGSCDHEDDEPPWTFVTTMHYADYGVQKLITEFIIGSPKLSVEFLPFNTCTTRATFKDLMLCCSYKICREDGGRVYYIANPLTRQWVALPPCPCQWELVPNTALICQPPNSTQDYKFRVVKVRYPRKDRCLDTFDLVVYCSEISEWKETKLRVPEAFVELEIVVCNGIIYFKSGLSLMALDPFDVNVACETTVEARVMPPLPDFGYLQESSGQLLLVVHTPERRDVHGLWYTSDGTDITVQMVVWKLDLNQAPLVWETTFQGLCKGTVNSIELRHTRVGGRIRASEVGVHPYNDKLIFLYLYLDNQLVLCDTRTGCITASKSFPDFVQRFHRLEQQWWPTSIPEQKNRT